MITAKWTPQYRRASRICPSLLQDLMKRIICQCGVEMLFSLWLWLYLHLHCWLIVFFALKSCQNKNPANLVTWWIASFIGWCPDSLTPIVDRLHSNWGWKLRLQCQTRAQRQGDFEDNINIGVTHEIECIRNMSETGYQFTRFVCFYPDRTWFIEEIEQQWSCSCSKSKTGGEILVRIWFK